jgi:hypothetical protein
MAIRTVTAAQILVGGLADISQFTGSIADVPGSVSLVEATTFASGGFVTQVPAVRSGMFAFSGYADHDATSTPAGISTVITPALLGNEYGVSIALPSSGNTVAAGDWCMFGTGVLSQLQPVDVSPTGLAAFGMQFTTDGAFVQRGFVGAPLAARTTTVTGTGVNLSGPSASQSLHAMLHVTATTGTNLVVKVQSDDNSGFTSPTDRITFATMSATGWQQLSVTGALTTETWWRVTATIGTGSFTFATYMGIA